MPGVDHPSFTETSEAGMLAPRRVDCAQLLVLTLLTLSLPSLSMARARPRQMAPAGTRPSSRVVDDPAVRVVGPKGDRTPVLNEGGATLQLKVVDASNRGVTASVW